MFLTAALSANAGLIGSDVTLNYNYDVYSTTDIFTVTDLVEVQCTGDGTGNANICGILTGPNQYLDFGNNTITYNYIQSGWLAAFSTSTPNGFDFQNLNAVTIHGVLLSTTITGLDLSRLTFDEHSIQLNMSGLTLSPTDSFTLTIVSPEPSAALMAGLGGLLLLSSAYLRRRQRRRE